MPRRDEASSSAFGTISALILLAPAIGYAVVSAQAPPLTNLEYAQLVREAAGITDRLLAAGDAGWRDDPDNATSLGLAKSRADPRIDTAALRALRGGGIEPSANGVLDYEEAKRALGIPHGEFQLRIRPAPDATAAWSAGAGFRVAYVAHYSGATAAASAQPLVSATADVLTVELNVTNQAERPAVFTVEVALGNQSRDERSLVQPRNTPLLTPGESHTVRVTYHALSSWDASLTHVSFSVTDPYGKPAFDRLGAPAQGWHAITALPTAAPAPFNLILTAAQPYFVAGSAVSLHVDHFGAGGSKIAGTKARLSILDPNGVEVENVTVTLPSQPRKTYQHDCSACSAVGNYTLRAWRTDMSGLQTEHVHLSAARMFTEKLSLDPIALREIQYLDALVPSFNPARHDPVAAPEGDVFGDDSNGPSEIAQLLARYHAVVVGSDVDQDALMPAATREGIFDWVTEGGSLIVLGLQHQPSRWLEATAGIGLQPTPGSSDAAAAEDTLLSWPADLRPEAYQQHGRTWRLQEPDRFEASVASSGGLLLGVSQPRAFGAGTIVLSAYLPGLLTAPHDDLEGQRLLTNLLAHSIAVWSVDLGPDVPADVPVAVWKRIVWAEEPRHGMRALVELELLRYH